MRIKNLALAGEYGCGLCSTYASAGKHVEEHSYAWASAGVGAKSESMAFSGKDGGYNYNGKRRPKKDLYIMYDQEYENGS